MAMTQNEASLQEPAVLVKLLEACQPPLESVERARFRATAEAFDELDRLERDRYVIQDGGTRGSASVSGRLRWPSIPKHAIAKLTVLLAKAIMTGHLCLS